VPVDGSWSKVVRTIATEPAVFEEMVGGTSRQDAVRAHDSTGFHREPVAGAISSSCVRALEEGLGSIEDIDNSMKLGCASDGASDAVGFCGLDTTYYISQIMFDEFKERDLRRRRC